MTAQPAQTNDATDLFGPDSIPWRLIDHTALVPAAIYNAMIFELYPPCAYLSDNVGSLYDDPIGRALRTVAYIYTVIYGSRDQAVAVAEHVRRMHETMFTTWAVTGKQYCAADPDNLLWLHMTFVRGLLIAHERYGLGTLEPDEADRCWAEFVPFATLQGVPEDLVPSTAAEADEYFARMWPLLSLVGPGRRAITQSLAPSIKGVYGPALSAALRPIMWMGATLLEDDLKDLIGFRLNPVKRLAVTPAVVRQLARINVTVPLARIAHRSAPALVRAARRREAATSARS